jgi:hypothetical protein
MFLAMTFESTHVPCPGLTPSGFVCGDFTRKDMIYEAGKIILYTGG